MQSSQTIRSRDVDRQLLSFYPYETNEPPGLIKYLSQGAAFGAFLGFLCPVRGMLSHPENGYNYILLFYLPFFLLGGVGFGVVEGLLIWGCTYVVGHRLNVVLRVCVGVIALTTIMCLWILLTESSSQAEGFVRREYLFLIAAGTSFGLLIGSKFHPLHELIRGTTPPRWPVLAAITGLCLRLFVILAVMVSVLNLILAQQGMFRREQFVFAVIQVAHFVAAGVLVFGRFPFWLLLPLALIVNFPIVVFITDVLKPEDTGTRTLALNYLALWGAFLSCRISTPRVFLRRRTNEFEMDHDK